MGRTALFLVMGLGMAFTLISYNIQESNNNAVEAQVGYLKYAAARNLARTGVHMTLRALDRNDTTVYTSTFIQNFNEGRVEVQGNKSGDILNLTSIGRYFDSVYTIKLKLERYPKPFPQVNSAVGIRATPVNFNMQGNPKIWGNDHDINGNDLPGSDGDTTGVAVMTKGDSSTVAAFSSKITGDPKVKVDTTTANPLDYINEYISNADYFYGPGVYSSVTWGSPTNPVIVVCQTPDTVLSVKFTGNVEGWGILVVRGSLDIGGNFKFHGLVIVAGGDNIVNSSASVGTPEIIGGIIMAGAANSSFIMKGTSDMKYSSEALMSARWINRLLAYRIIDWYE